MSWASRCASVCLTRCARLRRRVQELEQATDASQQNVSKHLGVLLRSGLVSRRKEGNFSLYAIADEGVFELCDQVCGGLRRQLDELDALLPGGADR